MAFTAHNERCFFNTPRERLLYLDAYPASTAINTVANDTPVLIKSAVPQTSLPGIPTREVVFALDEVVAHAHLLSRLTRGVTRTPVPCQVPCCQPTPLRSH